MPQRPALHALAILTAFFEVAGAEVLPDVGRQWLAVVVGEPQRLVTGVGVGRIVNKHISEAGPHQAQAQGHGVVGGGRGLRGVGA